MRETCWAGLRRQTSRPLAANVVATFTVKRFLLSLIAALVLSQSPTIARDRPGTPNQPSAYSCYPQDPMAKPSLCFTFVNTAGRDEVHFEIEMNAMLLGEDREQCAPSTDNDRIGCILADNGRTGLKGDAKYGIMVPGLEFDTRYCFKVRTRRADDQVVSELWSAEACAQTRPKPSAPAMPGVKFEFFVSEIVMDVGGGLYDKVTLSKAPPDWHPSMPYHYKLHANEDQVPVEACAENTSGRQCAEIVVSAKQAKVLSYVSNLAPPSPQGELKITGKAQGAAPTPHDPGPTGPNAFIGVWDTHTTQNGHFRLTFSESNGVLVGKFENLDNSPQYNGTLTQKPGTAVTGELFYTYVQPATKGSGSGEFIVENSSKLIGKFVTNDNPPTSTGWIGNRGGPPATSAR